MRHALGVARGVADVLQGGCAADPVQFGMTTDEERSACRPAAQVGNLNSSTESVPSPDTVQCQQRSRRQATTLC